jgi:hypothetical protein
MGIKRIITSDGFTRINGCFYDEFVNRGHIPIKLRAVYDQEISCKKVDRPVKIDKEMLEVLKMWGTPRVRKLTRIVERSPYLNVLFKNDELWDATINKICSVWGKNAIVESMVTRSKDTGAEISWVRAQTENGGRARQVVVNNIDGVDYKKCSFKKQKEAAGDMWEDHCDYSVATIERQQVTCSLGSHVDSE